MQYGAMSLFNIYFHNMSIRQKTYSHFLLVIENDEAIFCVPDENMRQTHTSRTSPDNIIKGRLDA